MLGSLATNCMSVATSCAAGHQTVVPTFEVTAAGEVGHSCWVVVEGACCHLNIGQRLPCHPPSDVLSDLRLLTRSSPGIGVPGEGTCDKAEFESACIGC